MSPEVPLSAGTLPSLLSVFQKEIQLHRIYSVHIFFLEFKTKTSLLEDGGVLWGSMPSAGSWGVLECVYRSSVSLSQAGLGLQHSCLLGSSSLFKCLPFGSCLVNSFCCWYTHFKILIPQSKVSENQNLGKTLNAEGQMKKQ